LTQTWSRAHKIVLTNPVSRGVRPPAGRITCPGWL
jgi:hypothetical protein